MIGIRIAAKKRWRQKKKNKKCIGNSLQLASPSASCQPRGKSAEAAELKSPSYAMCRSPCQQVKLSTVQEKSPEPTQRQEKAPTKPAATYPGTSHEESMKEIDPSELVRSEKSLGQGTFGMCYLAHYRGIMVAVKEFKLQKSRSTAQMKREVIHEAKMICHLGDHRGLPLLFGVVTKSVPLRLITQFHGTKRQSITLRKGLKHLKEKLDKPCWLDILKNIIKALDHVHGVSVLHNDLKSDNVLLEKREEKWNPVIIDFGKARFISTPKPLMSLSSSAQERYHKLYPHIATEIVQGTGQQSVASDVFSLGRMALAVLDLLPTATAISLRSAKRATSDDPAKRPSLKEMLDAL